MKRIHSNRRRVILTSMPSSAIASWTAPVVLGIILPAHAATSVPDEPGPEDSEPDPDPLPAICDACFSSGAFSVRVPVSGTVVRRLEVSEVTVTNGTGCTGDPAVFSRKLLGLVIAPSREEALSLINLSRESLSRDLFINQADSNCNAWFVILVEG